MNWTSVDTWIVITGTLSAGSCALLGNYLVLRRMSMMGDAISHAILPGLAIAFLITHSRDSVPMFLGAAVIGVLTAVFTLWIHNFGKLDQNASMGVVFTTLFAIGLLLIVRALDEVHLDAACVLYGALEATPLDTVTIGGLDTIPRAAVTLACIFLVNLTVIMLFYKELKISAFDPALATTLGINANAMLYLLMALVAMTTVASFDRHAHRPQRHRAHADRPSQCNARAQSSGRHSQRIARSHLGQRGSGMVRLPQHNHLRHDGGCQRLATGSGHPLLSPPWGDQPQRTPYAPGAAYSAGRCSGPALPRGGTGREGRNVHD